MLVTCVPPSSGTDLVRSQQTLFRVLHERLCRYFAPHHYLCWSLLGRASALINVWPCKLSSRSMVICRVTGSDVVGAMLRWINQDPGDYNYDTVDSMYCTIKTKVPQTRYGGGRDTDL